MRIVARYSFNNGEREIKKRHRKLLAEVESVIREVDARKCKTKVSKETTMADTVLFSPKELNAAFKAGFKQRGWSRKKIYCDYSTDYYLKGYTPVSIEGQRPYREMDFLKNKLGVEVQFGKYAFMVYNVCAKMTIFKNLGYIDCGIEIVPVRGFTEEMSTGVAYFEQFTWDLDKRGVGDIDIPVLILGIDADVLIEASEESSATEAHGEFVQELAASKKATTRSIKPG